MTLTVQTPLDVQEEVHGIQLTPETRLQLAPGLRTRFDAAGHVLVDAPAGPIVDVGPRGFAALSLFSRPVALGDAIDRLEADERRATDFLLTMSVINTLIQEGVLVEPDGGPGPTTGWADPVEHARMLDDSRRTNDYLAAIADAVRPGDVVLDIGTGSGILAVAAARAGARRVFAVEASDIAGVAERVFAANGVDDSVTLVAGWSRQIELPERADLLVSEVIGSEPFEEEILETTLDARRRLLKPEARLIPSKLTLLARPLMVPDAEARLHVIGHSAVERWRGSYGMEFQPLVDAAIRGPVHTQVEGEVVTGWPPVGPPVFLTAVDLASFDSVSIRASADLSVDSAATVNAVAVTFRADLHDSIVHTLDPWKWPASSWATSVWLFPDPIHVGPQEVLRVHYDRRAPGKRDGITCEIVSGRQVAQVDTGPTDDRRQ
jgi:SAM-dependent methyltransferase